MRVPSYQIGDMKSSCRFSAPQRFEHRWLLRCSTRRRLCYPSSGWSFCRKNLGLCANRESVHHVRIEQQTLCSILHTSPQCKLYFYSKRRWCRFFKHPRATFTNTPSHHPPPHLIAPNPAHPQSGRTLNSVPSPAAPSRPLLSSSPTTISLRAATVARGTLPARLHHHAEADLQSPGCIVASRDAQPAADLFPDATPPALLAAARTEPSRARAPTVVVCQFRLVARVWRGDVLPVVTDTTSLGSSPDWRICSRLASSLCPRCSRPSSSRDR
jgi:hypothetical protein